MKSGARWLAAILLFAGLILLAQVIALARAKAALTDVVSEYIGPGLHIERLRWRFPIGFAFMDIQFKDPEGISWFRADAVEARVRLSSWYPPQVSIDTLRVSNPWLKLQRDEHGKWEETGSRAFAMCGALLQGMGISAGVQDQPVSAGLSVENGSVELEFRGPREARIGLAEVWMNASHAGTELERVSNRVHLEFRGRLGEPEAESRGSFNGYAWFEWPAREMVATLNLEELSLLYLMPLMPETFGTIQGGSIEALVDAQAKGGDLWIESDMVASGVQIDLGDPEEPEIMGLPRDQAEGFLERCGGRIPIDLRLEGPLSDPGALRIARLYSTLMAQGSEALQSMTLRQVLSGEALTEAFFPKPKMEESAGPLDLGEFLDRPKESASLPEDPAQGIEPHPETAGLDEPIPPSLDEPIPVFEETPEPVKEPEEPGILNKGPVMNFGPRN
ncbi:MAG: AsmA family protein [Candidatus Omnitrophica bacterium]|nr:AsmA family protein [Candidatus Omnitrophota bacterium]